MSELRITTLIMRDNVLTFPSERHIRRLSSAISVDMTLADSAKSYLIARKSKLSDKVLH